MDLLKWMGNEKVPLSWVFNLFNFSKCSNKHQLRLPVAWDYANWGNFSSGAVSLGNVSFEFVFYKSVKKTKFDAIALEPRQHIEEFIVMLDSNKIEHDTIANHTFTNKDGSIGGWSTVNFRNFLPPGAGLFICDYKKRENMLLARLKNSTSLIKHKGGSLGIVSLKEIVIGSPDPLLNKPALEKLPGIIINKPDFYSFSEGAIIHLEKSDSSRIKKIVIQVHSLDAAKKYLQLHALLGKVSENGIYLNSEAVDGLSIEFVSE
jgi:hypothetical protein